MRGFLMAAAAAAMVGLLGGGAQAQSLPPGSYKDTCTNASMDGETLKATCKRFDGSTNKTDLPFASSCVGTISNVNGILVCTGPTGSFARTCHNASVEGHILTATCQKRDGSWTRSSTSFSGFQHPVTNCDGQLVDRPNC